jgi:hypothetical protein
VTEAGQAVQEPVYALQLVADTARFRTDAAPSKSAAGNERPAHLVLRVPVNRATPTAAVLAVALWVQAVNALRAGYFSIGGFLIGYLSTRLLRARAYEQADLNTFDTKLESSVQVTSTKSLEQRT